MFLTEQLGLALEHARQGIALYDFNEHRNHAFLYGGHDPGVCGRMIGALIAWLLGLPDQARVFADEAVELGRRLGHPFSLGLALSFVMSVHKLRREPELVARRGAELLELLAEHRLGLAHVLGTAKMVRGWAAFVLGHRQEELEQLKTGLDEVRASGFPRFVFQLNLLAEALLWAGDRARGLEAIAEATEVIEATGERLWQAELQRLKGELLLTLDGSNAAAAEACFRQAIEVAQRQEAKSLELRAATSLARLWTEQGKQAEAQDLLAPIYGWFTEGFETADLKDAKALLDELR